MTKQTDEATYKQKLEDIGKRLMGSPNAAELKTMQLQMDALQKWARLSLSAAADMHDHDHMDDHDHAMPTEIVALTERALTP